MSEFEQARIKHIAIYPIKSGGRLELEEALLTPAGLETLNGFPDHGLMIVRGTPDDSGVHRFITQRDINSKATKTEPTQSFAELALIKPQFIESELFLTWNGLQPVEVPREFDNTKVIDVSVWLHNGPAIELHQLSEWTSDMLKFNVKVVSASGPWNRMTRQNYIVNKNPVRTQDGYSVHWFPMEDVSELSQYAGVNVPWTRFRPQIVVEGMPAQSVHQVFEGTIAGIPFVDAKPCERCQIPQIDQDNGKITNIRPLALLKNYKRWVKKDGDVGYIFGENMLPLDTGRISLGDELIVSSHRNPSLVYGS